MLSIISITGFIDLQFLSQEDEEHEKEKLDFASGDNMCNIYSDAYRMRRGGG